MADKKIVTVLLPEDEFPHEPDAASNYNESMYLNGFDHDQEVGGWFRLGNRVNEGYAEMSVCLYLPDGRVGFMFGRPAIDSNDKMEAGGLSIEVVEPFEHLRVTYDWNVCVLDEPAQMADPRTAFKSNPHEACRVELDVRGTSPMFGGKPQYEDGSELPNDAGSSFFKAHYEQHTSVTGGITVGDAGLAIDGLGLRDKSWGPRHWSSVGWYRWLPMNFSPDFAMMMSITSGAASGGADAPEPKRGGMVYVDGEYHTVRDCRIESEWNDDKYQTAMKAWCRTDHAEYDIEGEVVSLIPLRSRRTSPDGEKFFTRITEAMTRYTCNGQVGYGMSEYLDQVVDGAPIGADIS